MGQECHGSCSNDHHGHSHSKSGCCGGSCHNSSCSCQCHQHGEGCESSCHHHGKYADELLCLADEAWMEILKEKIKDEIRTNAGEQLTQMAKLVSTANHARWKDKMQGKKDHEDYEDRLRSLLTGHIQK